MKYEMIFGDQSLFDNASDGAVLAIKDTTSGRIHFFTNEGWIKSGLKHERHIGTSDNGIAMRCIIKEPKQWTLEDSKAGVLPEVGSMILFINDMKQVEFAGTDGWNYVWYFKRDSGAFGSAYFNCFKPIETPEEKARRERDEWAKKASQFIDDELDCVNLVGEHVMRRFYNTMLSGELPVPVAPEQNK